MKENVGRIDQIVRSVVGTALVGFGIAHLPRRYLGIGAGIAAGGMIIHSAVTRVCPLFALLGLDSRSEAERLRDSRNDLRAQTQRAAGRYTVPDVTSERLA